MRISSVDARRALASVQKPGLGVPAYLRWVNRPLGGRVAVTAATLGATPNGVTAASAAIGAGGIAVLAGSTAPWAGPLAGTLLLIGYILDSADGQLARIQGRGSPAGEWLDHVVDGIRAPLVHLAVLVHLLRTDAPPWLAAAAGVFSVIVSAWFLAQLLAEKLLPRVPGATPDPGAQVGGTTRRGILESIAKQPQDPSTTYAVVMCIGTGGLFSVAYGALFAWHCAIFAASLRRKYQALAVAASTVRS